MLQQLVLRRDRLLDLDDHLGLAPDLGGVRQRCARRPRRTRRRRCHCRRPAPSWTITSWPASTSAWTPAGIIPTRYSWFLTSFGMPIFTSGLLPPVSRPRSSRRPLRAAALHVDAAAEEGALGDHHPRRREVPLGDTGRRPSRPARRRRRRPIDPAGDLAPPGPRRRPRRSPRRRRRPRPRPAPRRRPRPRPAARSAPSTSPFDAGAGGDAGGGNAPGGRRCGAAGGRSAVGGPGSSRRKMAKRGLRSAPPAARWAAVDRSGRVDRVGRPPLVVWIARLYRPAGDGGIAGPRATGRRIVERTGAGNGTRTRDIKLGKLALYQLSYARSSRLRARCNLADGRHGQGRARSTVARRLRIVGRLYGAMEVQASCHAGPPSADCRRSRPGYYGAHGSEALRPPTAARASRSTSSPSTKVTDGELRAILLRHGTARRSAPGPSPTCCATRSGTTSGPTSPATRSARSSPISTCPRTSGRPGAGCSRSRSPSASRLHAVSSAHQRGRRAPPSGRRPRRVAGRPRARHGGEHALGEPAERQRLQPDPARAGQRGEEQALAAEERGLDPRAPSGCRSCTALLEARPGSRCRRAASRPPRARASTMRAAGVDEGEAVALELLQDEALAAEQAGAELAVERDADRDPLGGAQEGVLLAEQRAAVLRRSTGMIVPG